MFIQGLFEREKTPLRSLSYVFCSDEYLLAINQRFLQHDELTDIISFDLSADKQVEGEVYISVERVRENARSLGLSFGTELHRVIFHGALHLCGYRDKTATEIKEMRRKEGEYLNRYDL